MRTKMSVITFENMISTMRAATAEQRLELSLLLNPVQKKAEPKPKAVPKPIVPMPETEDDSAPDASAYRVSEADIDHSVCVGREKDTDKRWKPFIFRERQCGGKLEDGYDLCKKCTTREEKYAVTEHPGSSWWGRVTEEPLDWIHMLGTEWAKEKKPKFIGSGSSGSVASDAASEEMEPVEKPKKEEAAAEKEAKKAEKAAKKEAEAEKAAKKEAKAKKEPKPKKAAVDPMNTIETMLRRMGTGSTDEKRARFSLMLKKVAAELDPPNIIEMFGDDLFETDNGNVYEWNSEANAGMGKRGDFVGRLQGTKGDYSIDTDGVEA